MPMSEPRKKFQHKKLHGWCANIAIRSIVSQNYPLWCEMSSLRFTGRFWWRGGHRCNSLGKRYINIRIKTYCITRINTVEINRYSFNPQIKAWKLLSLLSLDRVWISHLWDWLHAKYSGMEISILDTKKFRRNSQSIFSCMIFDSTCLGCVTMCKKKEAFSSNHSKKSVLLTILVCGVSQL